MSQDRTDVSWDLAAMIERGHARLTELGEWSRDNSPAHLAGIRFEDALACRYAQMTDEGLAFIQAEIKRLSEKLGIPDRVTA